VSLEYRDFDRPAASINETDFGRMVKEWPKILDQGVGAALASGSLTPRFPSHRRCIVSIGVVWVLEVDA
jgi:hypothetical protein